jgi:hypothetical protein
LLFLKQAAHMVMIFLLEEHQGGTGHHIAKTRKELVAQAYHPGYLGGWDWEDRGFRSAQANSS